MWHTFADVPEEGRPIAYLSIDCIADYDDDVMHNGEVYQKAGEYHGAWIEFGFAKEIGVKGVVISRLHKNQLEQLSDWEHSRLDRWCYVSDLVKASGATELNLHTIGDRPWDGNIHGEVYFP